MKYFILLLVSFHLLFAKTNQQTQTTLPTNLFDNNTVLDLNNWLYWQSNNGTSGSDPYTGSNGGFFHKDMSSVIYVDGLVIGAKLNTDDQPVRVGGRTYRMGMLPGNFTNQSASQTIYRIRPDWQSLTHDDLIFDAAKLYNVPQEQVTEEMTNDILERYASDWKNWPVDLGAPYVDVDGNGSYNPVLDANGYPQTDKGDYPGIEYANQVIWYVMNDQNESTTLYLYGSKPIGFELQVTLWTIPTLKDVIFKKFRFIYKGNVPAEEIRFGYFFDFDLGYYGDDLVGCDSTLNLAFAYNGENQDEYFDPFNVTPPAAGVVFLPSQSNQPKLNRLEAFGYFATAGSWTDPPLGVYEGTLQWFNLLRGYLPTNDLDNPTPFLIGSGPHHGQPTKFPLYGDPETDPNAAYGDIDGVWDNMGPGDRRLVASLPPVSMNPGETAEFTFALLGSFGTSNLNAVTKLKELAKNLIEENYQALNAKLVKKSVSFAQNSDQPQVEFQIKIKKEDDPISTAALIINSQNAVTQEISLYDDGTNGDSTANDNIWSIKTTLTPRQYPSNIDLKIITSSDKEILIPSFIERLTLRKHPEIFNYYILWENGKQDKKFNHKETVKVGFDIRNEDLTHYIEKITVTSNGLSQDFDVNIPPNGVEASTLYFYLTVADTGKIHNDKLTLYFDNNHQEYDLEFPITPWDPTPYWGDTLKVEHQSGAGEALYPIVADASLLNGHQYQVTFYYNDAGLLWKLKDLTSDKELLSDQEVPDHLLLDYPVIDGIQWVIFTSPPAIKAIVQVADADGPLTEDEFDVTGAPYGGNNVWHSLSSPNDANRFYISAGGGDGGIERMSRSIMNAQNHDFELRFTETGGIYTWWYDADTSTTFPIEAWDVGIGTFEDPSDDIRCLTGGYSGGATVGAFDFAYTDPAFGFPATDWLYIRKPNDEQGSYEAYEQDVTSGTYSYDWWNHSYEVLARIIFCDYGGAGTLPPSGTVIRFITTKSFTVNDTFLVTANLTALPKEEIPLTFELKQNYPNPFNPTTTIEFSIPEYDRVTLEIFNVLGQKVRTLLQAPVSAGKYRLQWDGTNEQGTVLPSGIYIYRFKSSKFSAARRMLLIR